MIKQKIIHDLAKLDLEDFHLLKNKLNRLETSRDILYHANIFIFQSSLIDHRKRLQLLKLTNQISKKNKQTFCIAHNLTLSIKVSKEIGIQRNLIKDSHKAIELWKSILGESLAINGLIFSYTDLGLIFSDYNLNSLAIKYLNKAESLLSECDDEYNPFIKLYVAYGVVYSKMKNINKSQLCYKKVIKVAKAKKDSITLIPILVNTTNDLLGQKKYTQAIKRCDEALKISQENKEEIYRPYIYHALGQINNGLKKYTKAHSYLIKAIESFNKMNTIKMISKTIFNHGEVFFNQKKYDDAINLFNKALNKNKKFKDYDLDITILRKIISIYKINNKKSDYNIEVIKLNKILEKNIKKKEVLFSDTNVNALEHLSKELDLSLSHHEDLKEKLNLESKKRELTSKALKSVSEQEFLKKIIKDLSSNQLDNKKIINICQDRLQSTKGWDVFIKLFNNIHPKFNQYIINKNSNITESELRVCNLIKMSFSSSEIAEILSISVRGVEQHRYRIRKKLKIKSDLTIFIQSI